MNKEKSKVSVVFPRNADGKYCFVLEENPKYASRKSIYMKWGPPAERLEPGEEYGSAALRAMQEEAGLSGTLDSSFEPYLLERDLPDGPKQWTYFVANVSREIGGGDHKTRWFTAYEISQDENVAPFVPDIMKKMGLI